MSSSKHVPKLSAATQKRTLGEVKKAEKQKAKNAKGRVRTTVVNACEVEWPDISAEQEKEIIDCLSTDLKCLALPNCKVPLNEIRKVKKEERRAFRHKWCSQKYMELGFKFAEYTKLRGDVILGVNQIATALDQNTLTSIIVEKDVDPPLLTQLLIPLANSKDVPIIAINGLNSTCKEVFNTRCIAIGFKGNCNVSGHSFNRIYRKLLIRSNELPADNGISVDLSPSLMEASLDKTQKTTPNLKKPSSTSNSEYFKPPKIRRV